MTAWLVTMGILAAGCDETPTSPGLVQTPTPTPTLTPTPTPTNTPKPPALNYVFLSAPATRPDPVTSLAGRYQLEIDAGDRVDGRLCSSIPETSTRRVYTADIVHIGPHHAVKLYDAKFLSDSSTVGYGCGDVRLPQTGNAACHQFMLDGDANALNLSLQPQDDWRGSEIWEGIPDGFVLAITGSASGAMTNGRIEANGSGSLWYGNGLPASTFYACTTRALRFTFTPK